jgi:hypothetical protein
MLPRTQNNQFLDAKSRLEEELLLYCARTRRDLEIAARIELLLQSEVDWTYLLETARRHGMMPLLFWHLESASPEAVPEAYMNELRGHFHSNNLWNLVLTRELLKVHKLFEQNNIFAVPYKGPTFAASVYRNLALRQAGDLDILVEMRDVLRAKELLLSLGYEPAPWLTLSLGHEPTPWRTHTQLTPAQEAALLHFEREYAFERYDSSVHVELQWRIIPRYFSFSLDLESVRTRLQRLPLGGGTVPALATEDLLLILCVHGSKHLWERLQWICDVAETIRSCPEMDWHFVMEHASALGSQRMLLLGLHLARELLEADLPEGVLERIRKDPEVEKLAGEVYTELFQKSEEAGGVLEGSAFRSFHYRMRERQRDRIKYALRTVVEPNGADWMNHPLPRWLFPLYYVIRPLRLAGKYGHRLARKFVR